MGIFSFSASSGESTIRVELKQKARDYGYDVLPRPQGQEGGDMANHRSKKGGEKRAAYALAIAEDNGQTIVFSKLANIFQHDRYHGLCSFYSDAAAPRGLLATQSDTFHIFLWHAIDVAPEI